MPMIGLRRPLLASPGHEERPVFSNSHHHEIDLADHLPLHRDEFVIAQVGDALRLGPGDGLRLVKIFTLGHIILTTRREIES